LPGDENESGTARRRRAARSALDVHVAEIGVADRIATEEPEAVALELEPPDVLGTVVCADHDCIRHGRMVTTDATCVIRAFPRSQLREITLLHQKAPR
jgi:hypothetical protein